MRTIAIGILALLTGVGCIQARYTQKLDDEGVVAIPNNSPENRAQAITLITQHVGTEYKILHEDEVVKGSAQELENISTETATTAKEYQIHYWKLAWRRGANSLPSLSLPAPGLGYIDRSEDKGIIAIPNDSKERREEAIVLIEKHLGKEYAIVWEGKKAPANDASTKYYIFYCKPWPKGEKPNWEPMLGTHVGWIHGGVM